MAHEHTREKCLHDQPHPADEGHGHGVAAGSKLCLAVGVTMAFVIGETVAGYVSHSLSLLSDAGHNLADAAALALSWYAVHAARKASTPQMTYGYHRVGILAALGNAVSLVVIALFILWEAVDRLRHPEIVSGKLMIAVALVAIGVNVVISRWLHPGAKHDLNIRSAYIHMVGDAISAVGVVIAGIVVLATGWHLADPVVSFLIAVLILWSSWRILRESINVLLEGTPEGLDMQAVEQCIQSAPGVLGAHDLHVWTVGPGALAASVHVMVADQSVREGEQVIRRVADALRSRHKIGHTTVQVEVDGHDAAEMYCCIKGRSYIGHSH